MNFFEWSAEDVSTHILMDEKRVTFVDKMDRSWHVSLKALIANRLSILDLLIHNRGNGVDFVNFFAKLF